MSETLIHGIIKQLAASTVTHSISSRLSVETAFLITTPPLRAIAAVISSRLEVFGRYGTCGVGFNVCTGVWIFSVAIKDISNFEVDLVKQYGWTLLFVTSRFGTLRSVVDRGFVHKLV